MGKSALSKLENADDLSKTASRIRKKDPDNARKLDDLAKSVRSSAIRQLRRRPKRAPTSKLVIGSG